MKHNPKEVINIITLVDDYISLLNQRCAINKVPKIFEVVIVDAMTEPREGVTPKKCKRLKLLLSNTTTNERMTLFSLDYVVNNTAALLSAPYKRTLYKDLLFNALGTFAFNSETGIKNKQVDKKLKDTKTFTPEMASKPMTPADAYPSKVK